MAQEEFVKRHIGNDQKACEAMLKTIGVQSLNELIEQVVPYDIRLPKALRLPAPRSEWEVLEILREKAQKNKLVRSLIGCGYYGTATPAVILRNVLENPDWYTSYTPYQAEISQGRLEALLNFQTMVLGLTGMEIANASLLDEGTAAAEAMIMMFHLRGRAAVQEGRNVLFIDNSVFEQTVSVLKTRSAPLGIELVRGNYAEYVFTGREFGAILQYPNADGAVCDYRNFVQTAHESGKVLVAVAADILALALLEAPGNWDADIVFGSTQRFGIPIGLGGPHAAYFATREAYKRNMPGRVIGISVDRRGNRALRMALQTREQHIKREKATSNICTAQALLATMAGMFAVYHGPEGIKRIARNAHNAALQTAKALKELGYKLSSKPFFDTLYVEMSDKAVVLKLQKLATEANLNLNYRDDVTVTLSFDELTTNEEVTKVVQIFAAAVEKPAIPISFTDVNVPIEGFERTTPFMQERVFNTYHSETEMMRYIHNLVRKDISLTNSMIPLGSCTMKLNSAVSMLPLSWAEFGAIHPFAPADQIEGYLELIRELEEYLAEITGFAGTSLQANSGAAGEYTGLMVIRQYHIARGEGHRNTMLIPASAHGTNPASAAMAGAEIVTVACDERGNIDVEDLRKKAQEYAPKLSAFMVTYPSTHGIFESRIREMIDIIHQAGGQVYMDGANMNAQCGLTSPGYIGADVCHLNLHKTFAIPHGGGGPGVGPICVASHLLDFLPRHACVNVGGKNGITAVASAPWGSASILPITYAYIRMLGAEGLQKASENAILNANYMVARLKDTYGIVYSGETGRVGHEVIVDCRNCKADYDVESADIARRLMDYGFHAPTLSFPVHETLMVEPTESESKEEMDRFCDALLQIREEMLAIAAGKADKNDNLLKNAPHTADELVANNWEHHYSREDAAYPLPWVRNAKFWPTVSKIDGGYGDRNLICACQDAWENGQY